MIIVNIKAATNLFIRPILGEQVLVLGYPFLVVIFLLVMWYTLRRQHDEHATITKATITKNGNNNKEYAFSVLTILLKA